MEQIIAVNRKLRWPIHVCDTPGEYQDLTVRHIHWLNHQEDQQGTPPEPEPIIV